MTGSADGKPIEILLVEDNPGDIRLTREALSDQKMLVHLNVVEDGVEAMEYLLHEGAYAAARRPDLVLLDLNLPKKNGLEVLAEIKSHPVLRTLPVVIMTVSHEERDIIEAYNLHANCYITKPVDFDQFMTIVQSIESFWFSVVTLPSA